MERLGGVRPRTFVLGLVATLVIGGVIFGVWPGPEAQELAGAPLPDTRFSTSGTELPEFVDALGEEGRRLYALTLTGDMVWTVVHGLTIAVGVAIAFTRSRLNKQLRNLAAFPLIAMVLDVIENSAFLAGIAAHPDPPPLPAGLTNAVTAAKYGALLIGYASLVVGLVAWGASSRQRAT